MKRVQIRKTGEEDEGEVLKGDNMLSHYVKGHAAGATIWPVMSVLGWAVDHIVKAADTFSRLMSRASARSSPLGY
jgi:hypothetical protein